LKSYRAAGAAGTRGSCILPGWFIEAGARSACAKSCEEKSGPSRVAQGLRVSEPSDGSKPFGSGTRDTQLRDRVYGGPGTSPQHSTVPSDINAHRDMSPLRTSATPELSSSTGTVLPLVIPPGP
jgi:hypothetical protein